MAKSNIEDMIKEYGDSVKCEDMENALVLKLYNISIASPANVGRQIQFKTEINKFTDEVFDSFINEDFIIELITSKKKVSTSVWESICSAWRRRHGQ